VEDQQEGKSRERLKLEHIGLRQELKSLPARSRRKVRGRSKRWGYSPQRKGARKERKHRLPIQEREKKRPDRLPRMQEKKKEDCWKLVPRNVVKKGGRWNSPHIRDGGLWANGLATFKGKLKRDEGGRGQGRRGLKQSTKRSSL